MKTLILAAMLALTAASGVVLAAQSAAADPCPYYQVCKIHTDEILIPT
jgi:Spy/CpxP family protein refolding chaperone